MANLMDRLLGGIKGAAKGFQGAPGLSQAAPDTTATPKATYGKIKRLAADKETEFVADLDIKIRAGIGAHAITKIGMYEADRYWQGEHWDDTSPPWMPKPMENWVFATIEQHTANLSTTNIVPIIYGQDPGDDNVAEMFDLVLRFLWMPAKLHGRKVVRETIHDAMKLGTGIIKVYWDNSVNGGRQLPEPKNYTNPLDQQDFTVSHTMFKGEVCWESIDPANVISDPSGYALSGPGACMWITVRTARSHNWVMSNQLFQEYLGKAKLKALMEELATPNQDKGHTEFYINRPANYSHVGVKEVMLDEVWMREQDEFGNWHINLVYKIGDSLFYYAEDIYKDGEYPFSILYDYPVSKSFFGMGEAKQVIPNQNTINQISRLISLNAMHMTNTQKIVTTDSGIDETKVAALGTMPGAVWKSRTPDGIKNLDTKELPSSMFRVVADARDGIRNIMAMDEANMGQFGGSVTAARGIEMIQNKAGVRDQNKGMNVEDFVSRLVTLTISRVQQFYNEQRYIPIFGEGRIQQFFPFKGDDYADIALVVNIEAGSGTPLNKQSVFQKAWDMFKEQGVQKYDPPLITVEELLKSMDGFPLKEQIRQRILDAQNGKQVQQAIQMAQVMMSLMQQGIDPSQVPPEQIIQMSQQMQQAPPGQPGQALDATDPRGTDPFPHGPDPAIPQG